MATSKLECLVNPDVADIEEMVDVIAVSGIRDGNQAEWLGYDGNHIPTWLRISPSIRLSVFIYNFDNIYIETAFETVATQLLAAVCRLGAHKTEKRNIIFVCHDIGGTIVKKALVMSSLAESEFPAVASSTCCVVFIGCPHRYRTFWALQGRLAKFAMGVQPFDISNLTMSLTKTVTDINSLFLSTDLTSIISILNISSVINDEVLRVFDPYETSMSIRSNGDDFRHLQVRSPSPHVARGGQIIPVIVTPFLLSTIPGNRQHLRRPVVELLSSQGFFGMHDTSPLSRHPIPLTFSTRAFTRMPYQKSVYFAFYEPNDISGLLSSIRQDLINEYFRLQLCQTFEFRDWDTRCNSVESMLCTFLATFPYFKSRRDILDDWYAHVMTAHAWSLQLLLSTFYDLVEDNVRENPNWSVTWILVNFDCRIASYQWLLSHLCDLLKRSELPFTLIIINSNPPELDTFHDCFEIISLETDTTNKAPKEEGSAMLSARPIPEESMVYTARGPEIEHGEDNNSISITLVGLIVEWPGLYPIQRCLSQLVDGWNLKSRIRLHFFEWTRLRKDEISPLNMEELLQYPEVTERHLFRHLWLPSRAEKVLREQTFLAAGLIFYAFHPLTVKQLVELEQNTDYGKMIGCERGGRRIDSPRTLLLLNGVIVVFPNEVQFRDVCFRDYFASELGGSNQDSITSADDWSKQIHSQLAKWCLQYIRISTPEEWSKFQAVEQDSTSLLCQKSFLSYAIKYWPRHAKMAQGNMEVDSLVQSILHDKDLLHEWSRAYWSLLNPAKRVNNSTIMPLAFFGEQEAESLFEVTMARYHDDPCLEDMKLNALKMWARKGNINLVRKVISLGLAEYSKLDDLLLWCFPSQNHLVVREVLEMATKNPSRLQSPSKILQWAAYYGFIDAVQMMIPLIPEKHVAASGCVLVNSALRGSRMNEETGLEVMKVLVDAKYPLTGSLSRRVGFSALYEACKMGVPKITAFLVRCIFRNSLNLSESQAERPTAFCLAVKHALVGKHDKTLKCLLDFGLENKWLDIPYLGRLFEVAQPIKARKCCTTLSSYAVIISGDSESLKASASSVLQEAFVHGSFVVLQDLLTLWGGLKLSELSSLLEPVIRVGKDAFHILNCLLDEGSICEDKESYVQVLKHHLNDAVESNNTELARLLLTRATIADTETPSGDAVILFAAYSGYTDMVDLLIQFKANLNVCDQDGWYLVHNSYDSPDTLNVLLRAGVDINIKTTDGRTALYLACDHHPLSVKLLLDHGSKATTYYENTTELSIAAASGNEDAACMLLEYGVDPLEYSSSQLDRPLLHSCVSHNLLRLLKMLLLYDISVDEKDANGKTAFNSITAKTSIEVLKTLKTRGASIDMADEDGQVPLSKAIEFFNEPVFNWLVEAGANINVNLGKGESILHQACFEGSLEMVKLLCENGANISSVNQLNCNALHKALFRFRGDNSKEPIVNYLIGLEGLDINLKSNHWGCCLSLACYTAGIKIVEALLEAKAAVDSRDAMGREPIHFALYRTTEYVDILLEANANLESVDFMKRNALHFAVVSGRLDVVTRVLDRQPHLINEKDIDGWSPLMWAVRICGEWDAKDDDRARIIAELIARDADPHVTGEGVDRKWTARELAYYYGHGKDVINLLDSSNGLIQGEKMEDQDPDNHKEARRVNGNYCFACLMGHYGVCYRCDTCDTFSLCFKCYRSRNIIHPDHTFTNPRGRCLYTDDPSSDTDSTGPSSTEEEMSDEEQSDPSKDGSDSGSHSESDDLD